MRNMIKYEWRYENKDYRKKIYYTVTDLLKEFLGSGSVNTVTVQQWKMCLSGWMLLRVATRWRTNEDAG
jgi:hypothetical protein